MLKYVQIALIYIIYGKYDIKLDTLHIYIY